MTIDELIEKYADEAYQFAPDEHVIPTKRLVAYEQAKNMGEPSAGLTDNLAGAGSSGDLGASTPSPATAHELSLERIQHGHTKAKLKATEEAYEALQSVSDTALVQKLVDALCLHHERYGSHPLYDKQQDDLTAEALSEAEAYLKQQEGKASEGVGEYADAMIEAMATALNDSKEAENLGFSFNERLAKVCFVALAPYLGVANQQPLAQQGKRAEGEA